jgi:hypothetical protein
MYLLQVLAAGFGTWRTSTGGAQCLFPEVKGDFVVICS